MFTLLLAINTLSTDVRACSIAELHKSANYQWAAERIAAMVDSAPRIVRAVAVSADSAAGTVMFRSRESIRGAANGTTITLRGTIVDHDDFNHGTVPYQEVRTAGHSECFASEYRLGAEYLLLLRGAGPDASRWWPLAPLNEQLRGDNDPWLMWVRERAGARSR